MENKRAGFTLVEIIVAILVMAVIASAVTISTEISSQSAQKEAERIQDYIYRQIDKADRMHRNFDLDTGTDSETSEQIIEITWYGVGQYGVGQPRNRDKIKARPGCTYSDNFYKSDSSTNTKLQYVADKKRFNGGGRITVTDSENRKYYVIIAVNEGRIRISYDKPASLQEY